MMELADIPEVVQAFIVSLVLVIGGALVFAIVRWVIDILDNLPEWAEVIGGVLILVSLLTVWIYSGVMK